MQNNILIQNFLEKLELIGIASDAKIEEMETLEKKITYIEIFYKEMQLSRKEYAKKFYETSDEAKEEWKDILELFLKKEEITNIEKALLRLNEIVENNSLDNNSELEEIDHILDFFVMRMKTYLDNTDKNQIKKELEQRKNRFDRLLSLGDILEDDTETRDIEDIDFLEEVISFINISENEKIDILRYLIEKNRRIYEKKIENPPEEIEELETLEEPIEEVITNLLRKKENIEKIQNKIQNDYQIEINIDNPTREENEFLEESLNHIKEYLIENHENNNKNLDEQLDDYFQENELTNHNKLRILNNILKDSELSDLTQEEQIRLLAKGMDFYNKNQKYIIKLSEKQKSEINKYVVSLYNDIENRELIYSNKSKNQNHEIETEAAYELEIILNLISYMDPYDENNKEILSKVSKRIEDILRCVDLCIREEGIEMKNNQEIGRLFFIKDGKATVIEKQIKSATKNNKRKNNILKDVKYQLTIIKNRINKELISARIMDEEELEIRFIASVFSKVFYIPIGEKDAIIIGTSVQKTKDEAWQEQKNIIQSKKEEIRNMINSLENPIEYESESKKSEIITNRIMKQLEEYQNDRMEIRLREELKKGEL